MSATSILCHKGFTTSQNSGTGWETTIQTHRSLGDSSHSKHKPHHVTPSVSLGTTVVRPSPDVTHKVTPGASDLWLSCPFFRQTSPPAISRLTAQLQTEASRHSQCRENGHVVAMSVWVSGLCVWPWAGLNASYRGLHSRLLHFPE